MRNEPNESPAVVSASEREDIAAFDAAMREYGPNISWELLCEHPE